MDKKYLLLLAKEFPTIDSAVSEIVNLSAIRSLPKGTEYFFSDIHGEYEAFLHMLKSASGMIKNKIDITLGKSVSGAEREALAYLIYYPDKQLKNLRMKDELSDEWRRLTIYRLILVCEAVSAKYTRSRVRKRIPKDMVYILDELLNVTDDVVKEYYYDEIITTILDTGIADRFIKSLCELIQSLAIDKLHLIGDMMLISSGGITISPGWERLQETGRLSRMLSGSPCGTTISTCLRTDTGLISGRLQCSQGSTIRTTTVLCSCRRLWTTTSTTRWTQSS